MRGRVFSSFYVMRDVVFLFGMAGAGLADVLDIRMLIVAASSLLFVSAAFTLVAPGLAVSTWGAASARLRGATAAPALGAADARGRDDGRLRPARRPPRRVQPAVARPARGVRPVGDGRGRRASGTRVIQHGDAATSAYFILDGSTTAGIPVDDDYAGLSTMTAGDFFGEIGALTGSLRTADVVADVDTTLLEVPADALRATMVVPEIQHVVLSTMTSRLQRTEDADLPRLAGIDQADLRDLRTPRPTVDILQRTYDQPGEPVA